MQTTVHRTAESLQALAADWRQLEPPTPFMSWEFVETWLAHQPRSTEPFVISVRSDDGALVAIAPWCRQRLRGGVRRLTGIGCQDSWQHDALILRPERSAPVGSALATCLWQHRKSWDWLCLALRRPSSQGMLEELGRKGWLVPEADERQQHHVIAFGESFEAFWAERSSSHRKKMRALTRHLEKVPHRYLEATEDNLDELLSALFTRHRERWQGLRDWTPYYEQVRVMCRRALTRGELCLGALEIQGRLAALDLAICSQERGYGLMRAYDPTFADYSPGALLGAWLLERLHAMGCRFVDCGPGHYEWKDRYSTGQLPGVKVLVTSRANLVGLGVVGWLGLARPWRTKSVPVPELKERLEALLGSARSPQIHPLSC